MSLKRGCPGAAGAPGAGVPHRGAPASLARAGLDAQAPMVEADAPRVVCRALRVCAAPSGLMRERRARRSPRGCREGRSCRSWVTWSLWGVDYSDLAGARPGRGHQPGHDTDFSRAICCRTQSGWDAVSTSPAAADALRGMTGACWRAARSAGRRRAAHAAAAPPVQVASSGRRRDARAAPRGRRAGPNGGDRARGPIRGRGGPRRSRRGRGLAGQDAAVRPAPLRGCGDSPARGMLAGPPRRAPTGPWRRRGRGRALAAGAGACGAVPDEAPSTGPRAQGRPRAARGRPAAHARPRLPRCGQWDAPRLPRCGVRDAPRNRITLNAPHPEKLPSHPPILVCCRPPFAGGRKRR
jgi:hypothetical protein